MITLIIKTLEKNTALNKDQLIREVAKKGVLASEEYMEQILCYLENEHKIIKLKDGQYLVNNFRNRVNN